MNLKELVTGVSGEKQFLQATTERRGNNNRA